MLWSSLLTAFRVYAAFVLIFALIPLVALGSVTGASALWSFWRALLAGLGFWMAAVYLLSALHGYQFVRWLALGVLALAVVCWVVRHARTDRRRRSFWQVARLLVDDMDPEARQLRGQLSRKLVRLVLRPYRWLAERPPDALALLSLAVLLAAAALRLDGSLRQVAPAVSDGYTHLLWTKWLMTNRPFAGGVYPLGFHAVAAVLSTLASVDPLNVLRFLGPLAGFLMVLGVYTLALEIAGNRLAALVAAAVSGLLVTSALPQVVVRQIAPLPQEFAFAFVPIGLGYAVRYLQRGDRSDLFGVGIAAAVESAVHSYAPALQGLVVGCLALGWLFLPPRRPARSLILVLVVAAATGIALIPLFVGRLMGIPYFGIGYVLQPVAVGTRLSGAGWWRFLLTNPFLGAGAVVALGLYLAALLRRRGGEAALHVGLGTAVLLLLFLYRVAALGLPLLPDPLRTAEFYSLLLGPAVALLVFRGRLGQAKRGWIGSLVALGLVVSGLVLWPPRPPLPERYQPAGAASTYLRIRRTFAPLAWTIVSPVQEYSEVLGMGWHVELVTFVRDHTLAEARDPHFRLAQARSAAIATPDVFLFVETRPLGLGRPLTAADLKRPLPVGSGQDVYIGANRAAIEARAYAWCEAYLKAHPQGMRVYFQSPDLTVFWLHRTT